MSKLFGIEISICSKMDDFDPLKTKKLVLAETDLKLKALPNTLGFILILIYFHLIYHFVWSKNQNK